MIRTVLTVVSVVVGISAVSAQSDPISTRKSIMKGVGDQTKAGAAMAKGEAPFDLTKAQSIFATYADAAAKMPSLFPANSKTGGETTAAPKVWEDMNGFNAGFAKMAADAKAAHASVKDVATFRSSFGELTKNCSGCHESYRIKKG